MNQYTWWHWSWDEVNFWNPSDFYSFRGDPGSPFFFRLKAPRNAIGGFGIVARFDKLPEWLAWECFEQGNGAGTLGELQARLRSLRETNRIAGGAGLPRIGCIVLSGAVFFPEEMWVKQPRDWGRQNMRYKTYDLVFWAPGVLSAPRVNHQLKSRQSCVILPMQHRPYEP
jgi:putative restriction endonuclease